MSTNGQPTPAASGSTARALRRRRRKRIGAIAGVVTGLATFIGLVLGIVSNSFNIGDHLPGSGTGTQSAPPATDEPNTASGYHGEWGPNRDFFTTEKAAPYAVLNSITDDPNFGSQVNFVRVRVGDNTYDDFTRAKSGDVVDVTVAVFNNASDGLAGSAATVHGLNARLLLPPAGKDLPMGIVLAGKNVVSVWDGATILTGATSSLQFVQGSATFRTNHGTFELPDSFGDKEPTTLGQTKLDGEYPVGYDGDLYQGNGYIEFQLRVV